jgi:hypothetical protein
MNYSSFSRTLLVAFRRGRLDLMIVDVEEVEGGAASRVERRGRDETFAEPLAGIGKLREA